MGTLSVDKILKTSTGAATFTLPATDGTANQVMQTDGSGQLSLANYTGPIATDAVDSAQIAADAVGSSEIAANAVGNSEMADDAVGLAELSATGTASASVFLRGDNTWAAAGSDVSGIASVQVFTTLGSQTWTRPTGITKVIIEVQGGGAGGGRHNGGPYVVGGSAGGYAKKFIDVSSISTSTVVIGAGGAGATANGNAGSDGADSSWTDGTNTVTGVKGVGEYSNYGTAVGGAATGGDINIKGGDGFNLNVGATGGDSQFGFGGSSGWVSETVPGAGGGYGSGGGGGYDRNAEAGAPGIVYVQEYK